MELALGTVQFGLRYGVAGRGAPVPEAEVREILQRAWDGGIRVLDTAPAYGDIEERLAGLMDGLGFAVVSKIQPLPAAMDAMQVGSWAEREIARSHQRLGASLQTLLFHRADDLLGPLAEPLWRACADAARARGLALGVSCYDPDTLLRIASRFPVELAQVPANALDQRVHRADAAALPPLHLRSAFLQGLLLMPIEQASTRVPAAAEAVLRWHRWCEARGLPPLEAALGLVKSVPRATHCVVGVDGPAHLDALLAAWGRAPVLHAPELAQATDSVIDPRLWPAAT